MNLRLPSCLCAFTLLTVSALQAHSVWIEPDSSGALVVRFAEPGMPFETSPGYLDGLTLPVAFKEGAKGPEELSVSKGRNHFLLAGTDIQSTVCLESAHAVRGGRKPNFYARWQPGGAGEPRLTLDLVPTGEPGVVRAYFRGKPLAGVPALLREPDGVERELTADDQGTLRFETPQSGQYLLTIAHHREPELGGFHLGRAYEQTSHNCALVWIQSE